MRSIPALEQPVERILSLLATTGKRRLLALAGLPGSGKSTLAAHLAAEVRAIVGSGVFVALGMDGFHYSKTKLAQMADPEAALARRGAPWTFDAEALHRRLLMLLEANVDVPWPGFQHEVGDPVEASLLVKPTARIILVEGLYLMHRADGWESIGALFEERWYLDTPFDVAMERLTQRHMKAWGLTREQAVSRIAANDALNAQIVAATRPYADRVIQNVSLQSRSLSLRRDPEPPSIGQ